MCSIINLMFIIIYYYYKGHARFGFPAQPKLGEVNAGSLMKSQRIEGNTLVVIEVFEIERKGFLSRWFEILNAAAISRFCTYSQF